MGRHWREKDCVCEPPQGLLRMLRRISLDPAPRTSSLLLHFFLRNSQAVIWLRWMEIRTIQAKLYVPTSFGKMMKINSLPKNVKAFNVRQISKLIGSVYSAKIEADAVDDASKNERQSCSEFVYDFMLNLYGLKGIAESAIHGLFKTIKSLISSKQIEKYHKIKKLVKENEVKKLDWDHMVETILESNPRRQIQDAKQEVNKAIEDKPPLTKEKLQELENLFIAGDANQDGVLTFTEFREIISTADPSVSTQSALRMFRETLLLMPDGGDSISPQAFATIAHSHGINAPPIVVFDLLKKTWNQVQTDINEDKMQQAEQRSEFEGLKKSLLFMLDEHKNVSDAVQVFQQLVLKFCGGNEEPEEPDQDISTMSESGDIGD